MDKKLSIQKAESPEYDGDYKYYIPEFSNYMIFWESNKKKKEILADFKAWVEGFAIKFKGISFNDIVKIWAETDGNLSLPVNFLIKKFDLPEAARMWLNTLERCQDVWERGVDGYNPEFEPIQSKYVQWYHNGYFFWTNQDKKIFVMKENNYLYSYTIDACLKGINVENKRFVLDECMNWKILK